MIQSHDLKKHLFAFLVFTVIPVAAFLAVISFPGEVSARCSSSSQCAGIPHNPMWLPLRPDIEPAAGKFLVAARNIRDPRFQETVILLLRYDSNGAMGLILNLPTAVNLSSVLPEVRELRKRTDKLFVGGPVGGNQLFLLIRTDKAPSGSYRILKHTYMSSSLNALKRMARDRRKGDRFRVFAGYAGWGAGQLEREIAAGSWYVTDADEKLIFDKDPSALWHELIGRHSGLMVKLPPNKGMPALYGVHYPGPVFPGPERTRFGEPRSAAFHQLEIISRGELK